MQSPRSPMNISDWNEQSGSIYNNAVGRKTNIRLDKEIPVNEAGFESIDAFWGAGATPDMNIPQPSPFLQKIPVETVPSPILKSKSAISPVDIDSSPLRPNLDVGKIPKTPDKTSGIPRISRFKQESTPSDQIGSSLQKYEEVKTIPIPDPSTPERISVSPIKVKTPLTPRTPKELPTKNNPTPILKVASRKSDNHILKPAEISESPQRTRTYIPTTPKTDTYRYVYDPNSIEPVRKKETPIEESYDSPFNTDFDNTAIYPTIKHETLPSPKFNIKRPPPISRVPRTSINITPMENYVRPLDTLSSLDDSGDFIQIEDYFENRRPKRIDDTIPSTTSVSKPLFNSMNNGKHERISRSRIVDDIGIGHNVEKLNIPEYSDTPIIKTKNSYPSPSSSESESDSHETVANGTYNRIHPNIRQLPNRISRLTTSIHNKDDQIGLISQPTQNIKETKGNIPKMKDSFSQPVDTKQVFISQNLIKESESGTESEISENIGFIQNHKHEESIPEFVAPVFLQKEHKERKEKESDVRNIDQFEIEDLTASTPAIISFDKPRFSAFLPQTPNTYLKSISNRIDQNLKSPETPSPNNANLVESDFSTDEGNHVLPNKAIKNSNKSPPLPSINVQTFSDFSDFNVNDDDSPQNLDSIPPVIEESKKMDVEIKKVVEKKPKKPRKDQSINDHSFGPDGDESNLPIALRRKKRCHVKPLKTWLGERIIYSIDDNGCRSYVSEYRVDSPEEIPPPPAAPKRKPKEVSIQVLAERPKTGVESNSGDYIEFNGLRVSRGQTKETAINPQCSFQLTCKKSHNLVYVSEGSGILQWKKQTWELSEGATISIPKGESCTIKNIEKEKKMIVFSVEV